MAINPATEIDFNRPPTESPASEPVEFPFSGTIGDEDSVSGEDVSISFELYVGGTQSQNVSDRKFVQEVSALDTFEGTLTHTFGERNQYPNRISVFVQANVYYGDPDLTAGDLTSPDETVKTNNLTFTILDPAPTEDDPIEFGGPQPSQPSVISESFSGREEFRIKQLDVEDDANFASRDLEENGIEFLYTNPSISNDNAGRFVKHEIIGGPTIRQKIGEDPANLTVKGICTEETAKKIDSLRDVVSGVIYSDRLPNQTMKVQFGSTSTDPISEGGGADFETGQFLYNFTINCIEITQ